MSRRRSKRLVVLVIALICVIIVLLMLRDSNSRIVTQEYELRFDGLPAEFDGYRVAVVSDLHAAEFGSGNSRLISSVRSSAPHMIAVTGDLIDDEGQLDGVLPVMRALSGIAPTYFITGNHEWATDDARELLRRLPEYGVTVLENRYETLRIGGGEITLVGIGDPNGPSDATTSRQVFDSLPDGATDGFVLTLVHRNTYYILRELAGFGSDLILCGHAHGGIIRLPFTDGLIGHYGLFPEYTDGVYEIDGSCALVSRGLGNIRGIPRFLNNPHVPVVVLRAGE